MVTTRSNSTPNGHTDHVTKRKPGSTNAVTTNGSLARNGHSHMSSQDTQKESQAAVFFNRIFTPIFLIGFSPNICLILWKAATEHNGSFLEVFASFKDAGFFLGLWRMWWSIEFLSLLSVGVILGYCVFAVILMKLLPGPTVHGPITPKGNVPVYCDNGFACYLVTMATLGIAQYFFLHNGLTATIIYDRFDEFILTLTTFSHLLCVGLYLKGLYAPTTSDHGSSGNPIFDYYWGTELYPRVFGVDIKVFTNCRFGMTVWPLLVTIHALKSYELHGFVDSMWVSFLLQMIYITKFFWWESGYMRTIDIMVDRAGFYICWGCLTFVPGLYASVTMYLVQQPLRLGSVLSLTILTVGILAIWINYWADLQKQQVRGSDGKCSIWGKAPKLIRAQYRLENGEQKESLLLVSGFWGISRHFHYVPELTLAFCWTAPALFYNLAPYSYLITLACILIHRTFRDDEKCSQKYTTHWNEYCEKVPYKMIPGVF